MKRIILTAVLATASPVVVAAQTQLPVLLQLPASTRALGLGNAYPLGTVDPEAIFYNPALVDAARGFAGSWADYRGSSLLGLAAGIDWWRFSLGIGLQSITYGQHVPETATDVPNSSAATSTSAQAATLALSRTWFGFRVGIAGKLVDQRVDSERDVTVAGDIGVLRNIGRFVVGVSGRNLGRDPDFSTLEAELPTSISLAAASRARPTGPLDLTAAASGSWLRGGRYAAGGGIEAAYWPITGRTFAARVGYRWVEDSDVSPLTLGAGFTGDRIGIDYAFENVDGAEAVHRVTLRWR